MLNFLLDLRGATIESSSTIQSSYLHAIRDVYRFRVFTSFSSVSVRLWHPFVPKLSDGCPWGFCLWFLRLKPATSDILSKFCLFVINKLEYIVLVFEDA